MAITNEIDYPPEATVGDQRLRGLWDEKRFELAPASPSTNELRREIARLAYELYLRRGRVNGRDLEDWLKAEAIVASRVAQREKPAGDHGNGEETE